MTVVRGRADVLGLSENFHAECDVHIHVPGGATPKVRNIIEHELALIKELNYEHYFLTVHDIVAFARDRPDRLWGQPESGKHCLETPALPA